MSLIPASLPVYLLAGGRASRFGSDKARANVQGQSLLGTVAQAVAPLASALTVVAERADKYSDLGLATIADSLPGAGPMGGLITALAHAPRGYILVGSCDVLGLTPELLRPLLEAPRERLALAFYTQYWHPLWALYHTDLLSQAQTCLAQQGGALWRLLEAVHAQALDGTVFAAQVQPINTPAQLVAYMQGTSASLGAS